MARTPTRSYDWQAGRKATLRNLLQGEGYESLDAIREEGREEGERLALRESILEALATRSLAVSAPVRDAVTSSKDLDTLRRWRRRAITVSSADKLLE